MAETSIWRWAITEDLDALFARLVTASPREFAQIAKEAAGPAPSLEDMVQATEAKMRAMGLHKDIMETMLKGLESTLEEEHALEEAGLDAAEPRIALASSQMFVVDPFASLKPEEVQRQVAALLERYRHAASTAIGAPGQSAVGFAALEGAVWVWPTPKRLWVLSRWQEDRDLPIDLEFGPLEPDSVRQA